MKSFLEWPREHHVSGQFEGAVLGFSLASRRLSGNLITAKSNLRRCYKDNGAGLFREGAGRITRDSDHTLLFGRLAIRKRGGGAALERIAHRAMEILFLGLSWLCVAKSQKPPIWCFSQTDFKQLVLDGFQGSLPANISMILCVYLWASALHLLDF